MRFIRYQYKNEPPRYGWVLEDRVGPVEGNPLAEFRRLNADIPLDKVKLLAPILPGKIICVGRNYTAHAKERGAEVPSYPLLFLKPPSAIIGPGEAVILPPQSKRVEHEAELVAVIGKRGRWIPAGDAPGYIFGFTAGNDVTARDLQNQDGQWTRAKGFDTFGAIGPWIETNLDPADLMITCHVNGEMRQMASTRDMIFDLNQLITFASSVMTLEPGDLIFTGTPAGIGPLQEGDTVEVNIEGIGVLRNPIVAERAHTGF
jgi:2-keto-4-pentenoate hydratase/2-oxohepta-3-ene-1,7-dioic acid hydratase in catechol pathway